MLVLNHRETQTVPGGGAMPCTTFAHWARNRFRSELEMMKLETSSLNAFENWESPPAAFE